jgi:hypothetical protein
VNSSEELDEGGKTMTLHAITKSRFSPRRNFAAANAAPSRASVSPSYFGGFSHDHGSDGRSFSPFQILALSISPLPLPDFRGAVRGR